MGQAAPRDGQFDTNVCNTRDRSTCTGGPATVFVDIAAGRPFRDGAGALATHPVAAREGRTGTVSEGRATSIDVEVRACRAHTGRFGAAPGSGTGRRVGATTGDRDSLALGLNTRRFCTRDRGLRAIRATRATPRFLAEHAGASDTRRAEAWRRRLAVGTRGAAPRGAVVDTCTVDAARRETRPSAAVGSDLAALGDLSVLAGSSGALVFRTRVAVVAVLVPRATACDEVMSALTGEAAVDGARRAVITSRGCDTTLGPRVAHAAPRDAGDVFTRPRGGTILRVHAATRHGRGGADAEFAGRVHTGVA